MADDLLDLSGIFGDTFKNITDALTGDDKSSKKKTTTTKKSTTAKKTSTTKKTTTAKKSSTAKKSTTSKKSTSSKKTTKKIIFEIGGRQIDMKAIERKADKLSGDVYVVANERKIYDSEGNSINLF